MIEITEGRSLGRSPIRVSAVGLGCWQFSQGRGVIGRYWPALPQEEVNRIVAGSLARGINWFDTAESYGEGRSEAALSEALRAAGKQKGEVVIATKWRPYLRTASSIKSTIDERLTRLEPFGIDLHQVHSPFSLSSIAAQMKAMGDLADAGKIRAVGVSNFSAARMRAAHAALAARGIPLVANQVRYNLIDRAIERNGVMDAARELGITIIAYSPLAQGILSGKYHRDPDLIRSRPGPRKWMGAFRRSGLERSRSVVSALDEIARTHGATASQVALSWLIHTQGETVVAIPGAETAAQAEENAGALDLRLEEAEMRLLEECSRPFL